MTWAARIPTLAGLRYPQASFVLDFASNYYRGSGAQGSSPSALPGYNFTRALAAYAEDTAGNLIQFASGVPRITNKGVLIEESRANLLLQSQTFDNASWSKTSATITADQAIAPDGTSTGDLITPSASTTGRATQIITTVGSTAYNFSVFIKQGTSAQSRLLVRDETNSVNFLQATAITWTGGVPSVGGTTGSWSSPVQFANGWWRISGTASTGIGGVSASVQVFPDNLNGTGTLYIWGAQLEAGSFPTSYIPTTSASVTRPADVFYYSGLSANASGTVAATFIPSVFSAYRRIVSGPSGGNSVSNILFENSTSGKVQSYDASNLGITSNAAALNSINNAAMRYTGSAAGISLNGGGVATAVGGADFSTQTSYYIGNNNSGAAADWLNGYIQRLAIYPFAASDAQLQSISSGNF